MSRGRVSVCVELPFVCASAGEGRQSIKSSAHKAAHALARAPCFLVGIMVKLYRNVFPKKTDNGVYVGIIIAVRAFVALCTRWRGAVLRCACYRIDLFQNIGTQLIIVDKAGLRRFKSKEGGCHAIT